MSVAAVRRLVLKAVVSSQGYNPTSPAALHGLVEAVLWTIARILQGRSTLKAIAGQSWASSCHRVETSKVFREPIELLFSVKRQIVFETFTFAYDHLMLSADCFSDALCLLSLQATLVGT